MLFPKRNHSQTAFLNDDDFVFLIGDSATFQGKKSQAKFVSNGTILTIEEVVVFQPIRLPTPGQPNTAHIEEEFDVAYYWDGEIYREFTSMAI